MKLSIIYIFTLFFSFSFAQEIVISGNDKILIDSLENIIAKPKISDSLRGITLFKLSDAYYKVSDYDNHELYKSKANKLINGNQYLKDISYFYNSIDSYLKGNNKKYLSQLILASNRLKKYNFPEIYSLRARIYRNIAVCYHVDNNEKLALKILTDSAIPLAKKSNDLLVLGALYSSIGVICFNNQNYQNAEDYYKKSIEVLSKIPNQNKKLLAETYLYYAHILAINNKKNAAKQILIKAKPIVKEIKDNYLLSYYYKEWGYVNHYFEEYKEALLNYDKAQKFAEKAQKSQLIAVIKSTKSNTLTKLNRFKESRDLLIEVLEIGESTPSDRVQIYRELADLSKKLNDFPKAIVFFESFTKLNDSLAEIETKKMIADLEVKFRSKENQDKIRYLEMEKRESELRHKSYKLTYLLLGLVLVILILIIIFLWKNSKSQKLLVKEIEKNNYQNIVNINNQKEIEIMQAMIAGEESERKRIARDLHDGIGSRLSSLKMQLNGIESKYNNTIDEIKDLSESLSKSISDLRRTAFNLVPETLSKLGLELALKDLCFSMNNPNVTILFSSNHIKNNIITSHQTTIFRIVQELINNALKHSNCTEIIVDCSQNEQLFLITVEDNGIGFSSKSIENFSGLGLKNIKSRVDSLRGNIDYSSSQNRGTIFNIELQVQTENESKL